MLNFFEKLLERLNLELERINNFLFNKYPLLLTQGYPWHVFWYVIALSIGGVFFDSHGIKEVTLENPGLFLLYIYLYFPLFVCSIIFYMLSQSTFLKITTFDFYHNRGKVSFAEERVLLFVNLVSLLIPLLFCFNFFLRQIAYLDVSLIKNQNDKMLQEYVECKYCSSLKSKTPKQDFLLLVKDSIYRKLDLNKFSSFDSSKTVSVILSVDSIISADSSPRINPNLPNIDSNLIKRNLSFSRLTTEVSFRSYNTISVNFYLTFCFLFFNVIYFLLSSKYFDIAWKTYRKTMLHRAFSLIIGLVACLIICNIIIWMSEGYIIENLSINSATTAVLFLNSAIKNLLSVCNIILPIVFIITYFISYPKMKYDLFGKVSEPLKPEHTFD